MNQKLVLFRRYLIYDISYIAIYVCMYVENFGFTFYIEIIVKNTLFFIYKDKVPSKEKYKGTLPAKVIM